MSAQQVHPASLSQAHRRIEDLREELDLTIASVAQLSRIGRTDIALRLVAEQREALSVFADRVARDVAPPRRRAPGRARRRVAAVVAAAVVGVTMLASIGQGDQPAIAATTAQLEAAERVSDPAVRIASLRAVLDRAARIEGAEVIRSRVADAAKRTRDELRRGGERSDPTLMDEAERLVDDASRTRPPGAPSTDQGPIPTVTESIPRH